VKSPPACTRRHRRPHGAKYKSGLRSCPQHWRATPTRCLPLCAASLSFRRLGRRLGSRH
jgi:hypothetical protein